MSRLRDWRRDMRTLALSRESYALGRIEALADAAVWSPEERLAKIREVIAFLHELNSRDPS